jgi:hypothetical protein
VNEREMKLKAIKYFLGDYFSLLSKEGEIKDALINTTDLDFLSESILKEIEQVEINFEMAE